VAVNPSSPFIYRTVNTKHTELLEFASPLKNTFLDEFYLNSDSGFRNMTYQEAHEVKGEDSGNPTKRQALEHCAADPSRVTEVLGAIIGRHRRAALGIGASLRPPTGHYQYQ